MITPHLRIHPINPIYRAAHRIRRNGGKQIGLSMEEVDSYLKWLNLTKSDVDIKSLLVFGLRVVIIH